MNRLRDRKALIIGGGTGIGRAVSELFAAEGAAVMVGDLRPLPAGDDLLGRLGDGAGFVRVDVREEAAVKAAVAETVAQFGRLDILVNNAGIDGYRGPVADHSTEAFDDVVAVNLRGVFFGMKHAIPVMLGQRSGRIINTASQLAHKPAPGNASYCASKAGVVALTVSAALEVAEHGITVNAVCPGPTDTPMWRNPGNEDWKAWKIGSLPMKRIGRPDEIAWAYVFLASDEASYCTGQSLSPNGGDVSW